MTDKKMKNDQLRERSPDQVNEGADEVSEVDADVLDDAGHPLYALDTNRAAAVAIHCADPRFQTAFRRFITEELGFSTYVPFVIGGGAHAFGIQSFLPKNFKVMWQQIKFFVNQLGAKQIIIINHEDCIWYEKMKHFRPTIAAALQGRSDLAEASRILLKDFSGIHVRTFWAGLKDGKVYFEEL